jgi:restriction system protein
VGGVRTAPPGRHPCGHDIQVRQDADQIVPVPRKPAATDKLYEELTARVALRTLAEAFDAAPVTLVAGSVFNGYVSAKNRANGLPVRPLLLSVHAECEAFAAIVLDEPELDLTVCLRGYLNAVISPHPWDLEPVKPVLQFDLSRYKFVKEMSVVAGLDSRPDLLALKPVEFEHLIRELFEAIGLKSWVTQASKDEGVDGVAVNEDPSSAASASSRPSGTASSSSSSSSSSSPCTPWPESWTT